MTHILVGLGSCLFTMCSVHISEMYPSATYDPARICAQIVSGMGFLGSATIYKSNNYVKGINTAANLWISAAISMAIGADLWELAIITSCFVVPILFILYPINILGVKFFCGVLFAIASITDWLDGYSLVR